MSLGEVVHFERLSQFEMLLAGVSFMLTNSRDVVRRLKADGWVEVRIKGSHHVFKHPDFRHVISVMHPQKDLGKGLVKQIYKDAGWDID